MLAKGSTMSYILHPYLAILIGIFVQMMVKDSHGVTPNGVVLALYFQFKVSIELYCPITESPNHMLSRMPAVWPVTV